jgi:hypothetical protein
MLKVSLIGEGKPISYRIIRTIWYIGIPFGFSSMFVVGKGIIFSIFLGIFAASSFIWIIGNLFIKSYIIVGDTQITDNTLKINKKNCVLDFDLLKIEGLKLNYSGARGDPYSFFVGSMRVNDGSNNSFSFEYEGLSYNLRFLVTSRHFLNVFHKYVKVWKDKGINIKIFRNNKDITFKFLGKHGKL